MKNLKKYADLTKDQIGNSEEDVKINFIVPFLETLGHVRPDFEYKRNDIILKKDLPKTSTVIIETKRYGKPLDPEIGQLERYCKEEGRPLLGIITNGEEIRIYSPGWWRHTNFTDKLIYSLKRTDLKNDKICKELYSILSKKNLANDSAEDFVKEREKEIKERKMRIEQESKIFDQQIAAKEMEIDELKKKKEEEIDKLTVNFFLPKISQLSTDHPQQKRFDIHKTQPTTTRTSKTLLKVTLPNGEIIQESKVLDTFVKTIQYFGIDKVKKLNLKSGLPFISDRQHHNGVKNVYVRVSDNCYIDSNHSSKRKKQLLEKMASQLGEKLKIQEIITATKSADTNDNFTFEDNGNKVTEEQDKKKKAYAHNKYIKRLDKPDSLISQIYTFIKANKQVTRDGLETFVTTESRKSNGQPYAISGSYSRTVEALEKYNYITREDWISGKWNSIKLK